mmetsp:Transcript_647/g.1760  ORF Transcript_647/g.1760 Transcript_647/m.1760 type:complete len:278 (-) Transcript_647:200-1033(-)
MAPCQGLSKHRILPPAGLAAPAAHLAGPLTHPAASTAWAAALVEHPVAPGVELAAALGTQPALMAGPAAPVPYLGLMAGPAAPGMHPASMAGPAAPVAHLAAPGLELVALMAKRHPRRHGTTAMRLRWLRVRSPQLRMATAARLPASHLRHSSPQRRRSASCRQLSYMRPAGCCHSCQTRCRTSACRSCRSSGSGTTRSISAWSRTSVRTLAAQLPSDCSREALKRWRSSGTIHTIHTNRASATSTIRSNSRRVGRCWRLCGTPQQRTAQVPRAAQL